METRASTNGFIVSALIRSGDSIQTVSRSSRRGGDEEEKEEEEGTKPLRA
jgi:hypothetical protein